MKYSVLMPVYINDDSKSIEEAINSVFKQTTIPNEFVIICDGKVLMDVAKVINKYKKKYPNIIRILKKKHSGLGLTLRIGIKKCNNELIARIDADDIWDSLKVEKQLKYLEEHKDVSMLGTNVFEFFEDKSNIVSLVSLPSDYEEILKYSKYRNPFRHSSLIYKKSDVLKCGNYRDYPYFEDYDLWLRMIINGCKCLNINEPLTYMRINEDFYKRRGGVKYCKHMITFRKEYYKKGYFNFKSYYFTIIFHSIVCLSPNFIRKIIYQRMLRKKV